MRFASALCLVLLGLLSSCTDLGEPLQPNQSVSPSSLDFGTVTLENLQTRSLRVVNGGPGLLEGELMLVDISGSFSILGTDSYVLEEGEADTLQISFTPVTVGPVEADLSLLSNDPVMPVVAVPLTGTGTPLPVPILQISTNELDFGEVVEGRAAELVVNLASTGTADLIVSGIEATGEAFAPEDITFPLILQPGTDQDLSVTFFPGTPGIYSAGLVIISNMEDSPSLISLGGVGVPAISFIGDIYPVFSASGCLDCHGGSAGFTIGSTPETAYGNIVNQVSSCDGLVYVKPFEPVQSHLFRKVSGTQTCGERMPFGQSALDSTTLALIEVWIDQGAENN